MRASLLFLIAVAQLASAGRIDLGISHFPLTIASPPSEIFGMPLWPEQTHRQLYSSAIFSGPVAITSIRFYTGYSTPIQADYTVSLATVSAALDAFPIGSPENEHVFFSGRAGTGIFDPIFTVRPFSFSGPAYIYDPSAGNLLVSIHAANYGPLTYARFFQEYSPAFGPPTISSTVSHSLGFHAGMDGLATTFFTADIQNIPEPGTYGLTALGFGAALYACRKRRYRRSLVQ